MEPDLDKIRQGAELAMVGAVDDGGFQAYYYAAWISLHLREVLYCDLWDALNEQV
jgi:hypothetical protein